jgi:hypothetical protein
LIQRFFFFLNRPDQPLNRGDSPVFTVHFPEQWSWRRNRRRGKRRMAGGSWPAVAHGGVLWWRWRCGCRLWSYLAGGSSFFLCVFLMHFSFSGFRFFAPAVPPLCFCFLFSYLSVPLRFFSFPGSLSFSVVRPLFFLSPFCNLSLPLSVFFC